MKVARRINPPCLFTATYAPTQHTHKHRGTPTTKQISARLAKAIDFQLLERLKSSLIECTVMQISLLPQGASTMGMQIRLHLKCKGAWDCETCLLYGTEPPEVLLETCTPVWVFNARGVQRLHTCRLPEV